MTRPIITEIKSRNDYMELIQNNPGLLLLNLVPNGVAHVKK